MKSPLHVRRSRLPRWRRRSPPGAAPGTLLVDPAAKPTRIRFVAFNAADLQEGSIEELSELDALAESWSVVWINVDGLADVETLRALGKRFHLHSLALEDVLNLHQRPKVEAYEENLFVVTQMARHGNGFSTEQVSMFIRDRFLITFQEEAGDCFDTVRRRLRLGSGRLRAAGPDYLAYALLDAVIDDYFPLLEAYGERIEEMEERALGDDHEHLLEDVHHLKHDLLLVRRAIWPQRELINALLREETAPISDTTRLYLRDAYDHVAQLIDVTETYREIAGNLMDLYMMGVSNRMNEVMKVLTVIATIFIPLGFIAGVYGMNFSPDASPWNMPELHWYWGYPYALGLMAAVALAFLFVFWRKGWLSGAGRRRGRSG